jgi:hypothetical protein
MKCQHCGELVSESLEFCTNCGARLVSHQTVAQAQPKDFTLVSQAERVVYFSVARAFAWFVLFLVTLGMIGSLIFVITALGKLFGASTHVSSKDLERAIANAQQTSEQTPSDINPAELAKLDEAAYEIVSLLPQDSRRYQSVDAQRGEIKTMAANVSPGRREQLAMLHELGPDLRELQPSQRVNALNKYFDLKAQKMNDDQAQKAAAKARLLLSGWGLLSGTALLTLVTMILVLLAIERNTRTAPL